MKNHFNAIRNTVAAPNSYATHSDLLNKRNQDGAAAPPKPSEAPFCHRFTHLRHCQKHMKCLLSAQRTILCSAPGG